jgi:NrS-1  polymerase HBD domain/Helix-turn-helix domain
VPGREIYDGRNGSSRYLTVTGDRIAGASDLQAGPQAQASLNAFVGKWFPEESERVAIACAARPDEQSPLDDEQVLRTMFDAKGGAKWRQLFEGDHSDYPSRSEADLALCGKLRFYTRGACAQIDRLFRRSGLMRSKWDERHGSQTYGQGTVAKAIARGGPIYTPRDLGDGAKVRDAWQRKAFARIPVWVFVKLGGAGELACRVYGIIASYANVKTGEAWPSVGTIAAHLRVSERRVKLALATLKAAELVTSTRRPRQSSLYRLALRVPEAITPYAARLGASKVSELGHLGCLSHGTVTYQEPTIIVTGEKIAKRYETKEAQQERDGVTFPEPCIPLRPSARRLRDEMLGGPVGQFFVGDSGETATRADRAM